MSNVMDRKVVEMQFDNAQFEKGVKTSISTLDKLKESLKFEGVDKGFDDIEKRSGKVDFSGMRDAIDTVSYKFSALESIALGALLRIGERAVDAGIKLAKSLSVDNVTAGWSKFEEKTKSVGTLIAQGYDLALVNEQLEKLNFFTDETSYSFTNMVAEIAKFTATGKGLEDSVTAMMGIANWAAMSGQNASTASRAMFQLSQAMGSGVMRKEDYKSIQNVSMDTKEFRQRALDAGIALGTLKKNADGTYQSLIKGAKSSKFTISQFADHLTQDAWFTSDVMMKVYSEYAYAVDEVRNYMIENGVDTASEAMRQLAEINKTETDENKKALMDFGLKALKAAQEARSWGDTVESVREAVASGFAKTFEIIFGQYDEAVDLWTDLAERLYEAFATPLNNFNDILETALKEHDPYINDYFKNIAEGEDLVIERATKAAKEFGYSSKEAQDYILGLAHGNERLAASISNYVKLFKLAGEGDKVAGASADQLIKKTAEITGATEEQIAAIKAAGDEYGYTSGKFRKEMEKTFGKGKAGLFEMTTDLLSVGRGLDVIEAKDLDSYLENTLKFTKEQVSELHNLAKEYGANSDQVDEYIKSLTNFTNFGHGHRGWTRTAIKGLLEITDGIANAELGHTTGDIVSFVSKMTGASEENVKILQDLIETRDELAEATEQDTEAIEENRNEIEKWASEIANGDEALKEQVLDIIDLNRNLDKMTGYRNILEAFNNLWDYLSKILGTVGDAFHDVFGSLNSGQIYSFTERLRMATERLELTDEKAEKLRKTFRGVFSIFKLIGQIVKPILIPVKAFFEAFMGGNVAILDTTSSIGEWLEKLSRSGKVGEKATKIFTRVGQVLAPVGKKLREFFDWDRIKKSFQGAGKGISGVFAVVSEQVGIAFDALLNFISDVTGWDVSSVKERIFGFFGGIKEKLIDILPTWEELKQMFEKIGKVARTVFEALGIGKKKDTEGIDGATDSVNDFAGAVDTTTNNLDTFGQKVGGFFGTFKELTGALTDFFEGLRASGIFTGFGDTIGKMTANLKEHDILDILDTITDGGKAVGLIMFARGFQWLGDGIYEFGRGFRANGIFGSNSIFKKSWSKQILTFAISIGVLAASMYAMAKIPPDRLEDVFWVITYLIGELVGVMELLNHTMTGGGITPALFMFSFALAIKKIVKAMVSIATDIPAERLADVTLAMSAVMLFLDSLVLVTGMMNYLNNGKGAITSALGVVLLSAAIGIVIGSMIDLANQAGNDINVYNGLAMILDRVAFALGALYVVYGVVNYFTDTGTNLMKGMFSILLLATAVGIIATSLGALALATSGRDIWEIVGILAAVVVMISVLSLIAKGLSNNVVSPKGASSLVILAAAIFIVARALSMLAFMNTRKVIWSALAISLVAGVMALVVDTLGQLSPAKVLAAGGALLMAATSIAIFAIGMGLFIGVLKEFSAMSKEEFWPAIGYFLVAAAALGVAGALIGPAVIIFTGLGIALATVAGAALLFGVAVNVIAAGCIAMANAILLFSAAWKTAGPEFLIGMEDLAEGFLRLVPRMAEAFVGFGVAMVESLVSQLPKIRKQLATIVGTAIGVICDSIELSVGEITQTAITVLIGVFDALLENGPELIDKLLRVVIMLLDGLGDHAEELTDKVMKLLINVIKGITKRIPELLSALTKFVKVLVEALVDSLKDLKIENVGDLLDAALGLMELTGILSLIALAMPLASAGVISIGALAVELVAVLSALGGISKIPGLTDLIGEGGALLAKIGSALGDFVGGFVGGVMEGVSMSLPIIGANLSIFARNVVPFIATMGAVTSNVLDGATTMAEVLLVFTGVSLLDAITAFMGADIGWAQLGNHMTLIGRAMANFSKETKDVDAEKMPKLISAAEGMAGVLAVFGVATFLDTVATFLTAGIGWASLKDKLTLIGQAMTSFSNETGTINPDKFSKVADASEKLTSMITSISKGESAFKWLTEKWIGKDDMGDFGRALAAFAEGIKDFSDKSSGIGDKTDDVEGAIDVANKALDFSKRLNGDGSLWDAITTLVQDEAFKNFGLGLKDFIDGVKKFAEGCPGVVIYTPFILATEPLIYKIIDMFQELVGEHSIIEAIATGLGAGAMAEFGFRIVTFVEGIKKYALTCRQLTPALRQAMINAEEPITGLIKMFKDLTGEGSILKAIGSGLGTEVMKDFGNTLEGLAEGVLAYGRKCRQLTPALRESISTVSGTIGGIIDTLHELTGGEHSILDAIAAGLETKAMEKLGDRLAEFGNAIVGYSNILKRADIARMKDINDTLAKTASFAKEIDSGSFREKAFSIASDGIRGLLVSIGDDAEMVKSKIKTLMDDIVKTFKSGYSEFYRVGSFLIRGFVSGMVSVRKDVKAEAANIVSIANNAMRNEAKINSPSKVTTQFGRYWGQGFVDGVSDFVEVAGTTAAEMGENALDGLRNTLSNPFETNDFDNTITIKPVIDLSEIQNGTGEIDRMLGGLNGYAINGSLSLSRSAADSMSGRGNGYEVNGFDKVTKAVENLGDKLEKPVEQHNNFNFYGATNDEIIREVKKTLTRDIIKEGRKWA